MQKGPRDSTTTCMDEDEIRRSFGGRQTDFALSKEMDLDIV